MKFDNILSSAIRKESFYIPKEMIINGSVKADAPGQIAGTVHGDVLIKNKLIILKEAVINGNISAEELIVFGNISGDVKYCQKITVHSEATIKGNINTVEIHIEKDAVIEGIITKSGIHTMINKKKESMKENESVQENTQQPVAGKNLIAERQAWF